MVQVEPVVRLDAAIPAVWRSPWRLQFGADPPLLVLDAPTPADERMIAALERGTTASGLAAIADATAATRLLGRLAPVLERPVATPPRPEPRVRSAAARDVLAQLAALLPAPADRGAGRRDDPRPVLLVVDHAVAPAEHLPWLRADRPHLAVVFGARSAEIGPVVHPGRTACLRCRDLHRRDADPAWAAIATQLVGRPAAAAADPVLRAESLAVAVRALAVEGDAPGAATALRIEHDGARREVAVAPHPECGCLGLSDPPPAPAR